MIKRTATGTLALTALLVALAASDAALAENTAEPSGDGGPGLHIEDFSVSGWLWGENIGWISLTCENTASCEASTFGIRHDGTGRLAGWAWAENAGWIDFSPVGAGVVIDPGTGELSGEAWGENIGWITFKSSGTFPHVVKTAWNCNPPPVPPVDPPSIRAGKVSPVMMEMFWAPVPDATGYDVVFGELNTLLNDPLRFQAATLGCIGENIDTTGLVFEGTPPPPGDGFWFLVRGVNCGGVGTYNTLLPSQPDDRDVAIGTSTLDCHEP
jgi:hypothetical protein